LSGYRRSTPSHHGLTATRSALDMMSADPNVKRSVISRVLAPPACRGDCRMTTVRHVSRLPRRARHAALCIQEWIRAVSGSRTTFGQSNPLPREPGCGPSFRIADEAWRIEGVRASRSRAPSRRSSQEISWVEFIQAANPNLPILLVTVESGRA
jgi:hypothetical protein